MPRGRESLKFNSVENSKTYVLAHNGQWYSGENSEILDYSRVEIGDIACVNKRFYRLTATKGGELQLRRLNDEEVYELIEGSAMDYLDQYEDHDPPFLVTILVKIPK